MSDVDWSETFRRLNSRRFRGQEFTVYRIVYLCLEEYEQARNLDSYLVDLVRTEVLRLRGLLTDETTHAEYLELLAREILPAASTIYTIRRKIQAEGLFPPTDLTVLARRVRASEAHRLPQQEKKVPPRKTSRRGGGK